MINETNDIGLTLLNRATNCYAKWHGDKHARWLQAFEYRSIHEPFAGGILPPQIATIAGGRPASQRELDGATAVGADDGAREGDQADQARAAVDREFGIVNRERTQSLLNQIERALVRLDNGTYGYCEDTGEPIDLRRLDAQPTATLTTEAQAKRERPGT